MKTSKAGIDFIKKKEVLELVAYKPTPNDVWTIGYGDTENVYEGMIITKEQAESRLVKRLQEFEGAVNRLVKVPLTQNQFDALVSLVYNIGTYNFAVSTLLKRLNKKLYDKVPEQFKRWVYQDGIFLQGLLNRRIAEIEVFIKPDTN